MPRNDPHGKFCFHVEIDGITLAYFSGVSGLTHESTVLDFQEGGRNDALVRLPGQYKLGAITLKRGFAGEGDLQSWERAARALETARDAVRRSVDIIVRRDDGSEAGRYTLHRAWPSKWTGDELSASANERWVETLELQHEGIIFTAGGAAAGEGGARPRQPSVAGLPGGGGAGGPSALRRAADAVAGAAATVSGSLEAAGQVGVPGPPLSPNQVVAAGASVLSASWQVPAGPPSPPGPPAVPPSPTAVVEAQLRVAPALPTVSQPSPAALTAALAAPTPPTPPAPPAPPALPPTPAVPGPPSPPAVAPLPVPATGTGFAPPGVTISGPPTDPAAWSDGVAVQQPLASQSPPTVPGPPFAL